MAQPYINLPDLYRFRVQKHSGADATDVWFNEYDVQYPAGVLPTPADDIVTNLVAYEQTLHYGAVAFDGIVVDDYHVGKPPPGQFVFNQFFPVAGGTVGNGPGASNSLAGQGGGPVGGEVCLGVKRIVALARRGGRNFYRGCLQKNDLSAEAGGEWTIVNNPQFQTQFTGISLLHMNFHLPGGNSPHKLVLVHTPRAAAPPHYVISLSSSLVASLQLVYPLVYLNKISRKSKR